jgi:hypothetical protein
MKHRFLNTETLLGTRFLEDNSEMNSLDNFQKRLLEETTAVKKEIQRRHLKLWLRRNQCVVK